MPTSMSRQDARRLQKEAARVQALQEEVRAALMHEYGRRKLDGIQVHDDSIVLEFPGGTKMTVGLRSGYWGLCIAVNNISLKTFEPI